MKRLIRELAETGREPTTAELRQIREHVAQAGCPPDRIRAGRAHSGVRIDSRVTRQDDLITQAEAHYAKHVAIQQEWPPDTDFADYLASIRQVVQDPATGIFLSRYFGQWQVGFVRSAGPLRGPGGKDWILVEYRPELGYLVTAFQLGSLDDLRRPQRSDLRWLTQLMS